MPLPSNKHSLLLLFLIIGFRFCSANSGSSSSSSPAIHHHHDHEHHSCGGHHHHHISHGVSKSKLPEELAEEEDLKLYGFGSHHEHDHLHNHGSTSELSLLSLWIYAMGCSFLVSMASLICLIILPLLFLQGKPSKTIVDSLAAFGAGAMLGDAFLHQLPHAFGGIHSHSHDEHLEHNHEHSHHVQSHSHSLEDLSVGLSILSGVILFLLVEKIVRYVEENSGKGAIAMGHGHHHHGHPKRNKLKDADDNITSESLAKTDIDASDLSSEGEMLNEVSGSHVTEQNQTRTEPLLRQRRSTKGANDDNKQDIDTTHESKTDVHEDGPEMLSSNLVFGYLNLFSDGVHNFTDGMALGSAFLLHGFVGGWSRTLFLLVHEIPQEVGDFGILVRSGFSVSKALFFNFLSALVALAGTALALLLGEVGQSSLIEGFTAGGFIYIAVAGVLPEMNIGKSSFKSYASQLTCLILGMGVALCISLVE